MPETPSSSLSLESAPEILESLSQSLSRISPEAFTPIRITHSHAWVQCQTLHRQFAHLRGPRLRAVFNDSYASLIEQTHDELLAYALAFYAACTQVEATHALSKTPEQLKVEAELRIADRLMTRWAKRIFENDASEAQTLRKITGGTGAQDTVDDVLALGAMFQRQWDKLEGRWDHLMAEEGLDLNYIAQHHKRATDWLHLKRKERTPSERRILRSQAFTALSERFQLLLRTGQYLDPKVEWAYLTTNSRY